MLLASVGRGKDDEPSENVESRRRRANAPCSVSCFVGVDLAVEAMTVQPSSSEGSQVNRVNPPSSRAS